MKIGMEIRVLIAAVAFVMLLIFTAPADAKQGGFLLEEPKNARMETYLTYREVFKNYTYELDAKGTDTWAVYDGTKKFVGDCEDFAFTVQNIIGRGSVYKAYLNVGEEVMVNHAVFVYAGMVWELDGIPKNIQRYEAAGNIIFFRMGDITPERR